MNIGKVIMEAREAEGLSRQELAERAGLSRVYVWQVETDKRSISIDVFVKIANALGVKPSKLLAKAEK